MEEKNPYSSDYQIGIGVMTGTSLDGLDLALCLFHDNGYEILNFFFGEFPSQLQKSLVAAHKKDSLEYFEIENQYSRFLGDSIRNFHEKTGKQASFVGIHGQTIFHEPNSRLTVQMLNGGLVAATTGLVTVSDFRRSDVALGGQGAPLVPIGDRDLFNNYSACLNLGGVANLSLETNGTRVAFDICPVNMVLNLLAQKEGKEYDDGGQMAASGYLDNQLLNQLNSLPFYDKKPPKSLGREWVEDQILPLIERVDNRTALRTYTEHAASQSARTLPRNGKVLVTGGGAYNEYLILLIRRTSPELDLTIPDKRLLEGKEALIFAYLAKLRLERKNNVLASVTGATRDSCSGAVYMP